MPQCALSSRMCQTLRSAITALIARIDRPDVASTGVIPWGCPVPSFGDCSTARVATLGLNPSNKEFVDGAGIELSDGSRRLHTLGSLGISCWANASSEHIRMIEVSCRKYFFRNPYDTWFRDLDRLLEGTSSSYYSNTSHACHLDLIPYATGRKWSELPTVHRKTLLDATGDTLGIVLRDSPIRLLVLNGTAVIDAFQRVTGVEFDQRVVPSWTLPRKSSDGIPGIGYRGEVREVGGVALGRAVSVLGFNHNIQSSFGVTRSVKMAIKRWIALHASKAAA